MADVKWIKFYVSILTNKKIKRIRKMPDGDTIALIWAFLLAQAGESNKDGGVYFNDEMPYSTEDFASDYDFKPKTVELAILTFEKLGMIGVFDGIIYVKNWEKYQSTDGMEKIREQNRKRQLEFKERKKLQNNVTDNVMITDGNATDIDIEEDIEEDIDKEIDIDKDKEIKKDKKKREPVTYVPDLLLNQAIIEFINFRKKKSPMTEKAISLLISKLDKMTSDNDEKIEILNQSILSGWTSVYPLKEPYKLKSKAQQAQDDFINNAKEWLSEQ